MAVETTPEVYQIHGWIQQISPMIWRRILVRSDSTLANLHDVLQIAFGWRDLQQFPGDGFSSEKTLVLISHFADPSCIMLL
ncbi:MAG TPA: hypothetical protein VN648_07020 [Candidatus Methylomirabilis sp.]|nr:hypothetical protein [Candidatus Methylomirabilis sp.]